MSLFTKKKKTIFIIEDNEMFAKTITQYIENNFENEFLILWYKIGEIALAQIHLKPDFAIVDYHLNSDKQDALNGLEIAMKMNEKSPNTQYIFLSSQTNIEVAIKIQTLENFTYLIKNKNAFEDLKQLLYQNSSSSNSLLSALLMA